MLIMSTIWFEEWIQHLTISNMAINFLCFLDEQRKLRLLVLWTQPSLGWIPLLKLNNLVNVFSYLHKGLKWNGRYATFNQRIVEAQPVQWIIELGSKMEFKIANSSGILFNWISGQGNVSRRFTAQMNFSTWSNSARVSDSLDFK